MTQTSAVIESLIPDPPELRGTLALGLARGKLGPAA
jgi:hypothetical protein